MVGGECIGDGGEEGNVDGYELCILPLDVNGGDVLRVVGDDDIFFGELEVDGEGGRQK